MFSDKGFLLTFMSDSVASDEPASELNYDYRGQDVCCFHTMNAKVK